MTRKSSIKMNVMATNKRKCRVDSTLSLRDIIEWDIPNWSVALQYWKKKTAHNLSLINALEVGARHGRLSLWAALNGMNVLSTDLQGPSNEAIEKHKKYNVSHVIKYEALKEGRTVNQ